MMVAAYDFTPPLYQVSIVQAYQRHGAGDGRPKMPTFAGAGTGGTAGEEFYRNRLGYETATIAVRHDVPTATNEFADAMAQVKAGFGRTVSHLPAVFGVSRQTLYNWLKGETPKSSHHAKLRELAAAARVFEELTFVPTATHLQQPILKGKSLIELLSEGADGTEAAKRLMRVVQRNAEEQRRVDRILAGSPSTRPDREDFGLPAFREE
jgi:hypothetical protein